MIPDPAYLTFSDWLGNLLIIQDPQTIPMTFDENQWRYVADKILVSDKFNTYNVPNHQYFDTWQDWAYAFKNAVTI